jgi:GTP-binding protein
MFIDEARILVSSGRGGDGVVHFRHEKYVPRGGPDGGDGGKGGDVIIAVRQGLGTLAHLRHNAHYRAKDGRNGGRQDKTGRSGDDVVIDVPPGTLVLDASDDSLLGDLVGSEERLQVCRGGRGGRGNARYATSRNQAPRMAERGEPGQERRLKLELRLLADVGIVGVPNAGKSTLLAAVSNARPKVADYPFTTLEPNLGVVDLDDGTTLVLADIPGLIEGAHRGAGLGAGFLRHVTRTRGLIHLIDGSAADPLADFSQINAELALFDPGLADKPQVLAINKVDLPEVVERLQSLTSAFGKLGHKPYAISALAQTGLRPLLTAAYDAVSQVRPRQEAGEVPVYRPKADPDQFEIRREMDGAWRVAGEAIERAADMTYWEYDEALHRFQRLMTRLGIEQALRQAGAKAGDTVRIGGHELEWRD